MGGDRLYLFPDTNIFMEFKSFDEIDWAEVAGAEAGLVVVIRPVVGELDRHKTEHRTQKKRDRDRNSLTKIESLNEGDTKLRGGTTFEVWAKNPEPVDGLDGQYPDDQHIASALNFARERSVAVAIVTGDTAMRIKARALGLRVFAPDVSMQLPPEPDEALARIRRLEEQIAAKPSAELDVTFADRTKALTHRFFRKSQSLRCRHR